MILFIPIHNFMGTKTDVAWAVFINMFLDGRSSVNTGIPSVWARVLDLLCFRITYLD